LGSAALIFLASIAPRDRSRRIPGVAAHLKNIRLPGGMDGQC
jgi:hypothetical protein